MNIAARFLCITCTLFFILSPFSATSSFAQQKAAGGISATDELAYWNQIKGTTDPNLIKGYLTKFPNGMFYDLALAKYKELGGNPTDLAPAKSVDSHKVKKVTGTAGKKSAATAVVRHARAKRVAIRHVVHAKRIKHVAHKAHLMRHHRKVPRAVKKAPAEQIDPFQGNHSGGSSGGGGGSGGGKSWGS